MNILKLALATLLVVGFSVNSQACGGGENTSVVINDSMTLQIDALVNEVSGEMTRYSSFIDADGDGSSVFVSNSAGVDTDLVSVSKLGSGFKVSVENLATGQVKSYEGKNGRSRSFGSCNEVKELVDEN